MTLENQESIPVRTGKWIKEHPLQTIGTAVTGVAILGLGGAVATGRIDTSKVFPQDNDSEGNGLVGNGDLTRMFDEELMASVASTAVYRGIEAYAADVAGTREVEILNQAVEEAQVAKGLEALRIQVDEWINPQSEDAQQAQAQETPETPATLETKSEFTNEQTFFGENDGDGTLDRHSAASSPWTNGFPEQGGANIAATLSENDLSTQESARAWAGWFGFIGTMEKDDQLPHDGSNVRDVVESENIGDGSSLQVEDMQMAWTDPNAILTNMADAADAFTNGGDDEFTADGIVGTLTVLNSEEIRDTGREPNVTFRDEENRELGFGYSTEGARLHSSVAMYWHDFVKTNLSSLSPENQTLMTSSLITFTMNRHYEKWSTDAPENAPFPSIYYPIAERTCAVYSPPDNSGINPPGTLRRLYRFVTRKVDIRADRLSVEGTANDTIESGDTVNWREMNGEEPSTFFVTTDWGRIHAKYDDFNSLSPSEQFRALTQKDITKTEIVHVSERDLKISSDFSEQHGINPQTGEMVSAEDELVRACAVIPQEPTPTNTPTTIIEKTKELIKKTATATATWVKETLTPTPTKEKPPTETPTKPSVTETITATATRWITRIFTVTPAPTQPPVDTATPGSTPTNQPTPSSTPPKEQTPTRPHPTVTLPSMTATIIATITRIFTVTPAPTQPPVDTATPGSTPTNQPTPSSTPPTEQTPVLPHPTVTLPAATATPIGGSGGQDQEIGNLVDSWDTYNQALYSNRYDANAEIERPAKGKYKKRPIVAKVNPIRYNRANRKIRQNYF